MKSLKEGVELWVRKAVDASGNWAVANFGVLNLDPKQHTPQIKKEVGYLVGPL